jgi:hypothetical protein
MNEETQADMQALEGTNTEAAPEAPALDGIDGLIVDENVNQSDLDVLTEDTSGVDTSMPLLKPCLVRVVLDDYSICRSNDGTKTLARLTFKTKAPTRDIEEKEIQPGYPLYHTITLTPSEKYSKADIKKKVAVVTQALGIPSLTATAKGKECLVKVATSKERTNEETGEVYPARTEIKSFKKL